MNVEHLGTNHVPLYTYSRHLGSSHSPLFIVSYNLGTNHPSLYLDSYPLESNHLVLFLDGYRLGVISSCYMRKTDAMQSKNFKLLDFEVIFASEAKKNALQAMVVAKKSVEFEIIKTEKLK
jgi:hypothetical protein